MLSLPPQGLGGFFRTGWADVYKPIFLNPGVFATPQKRRHEQNGTPEGRAVTPFHLLVGRSQEVLFPSNRIRIAKVISESGNLPTAGGGRTGGGEVSSKVRPGRQN